MDLAEVYALSSARLPLETQVGGLAEGRGAPRFPPSPPALMRYVETAPGLLRGEAMRGKMCYLNLKEAPSASPSPGPVHSCGTKRLHIKDLESLAKSSLSRPFLKKTSGLA